MYASVVTTACVHDSDALSLRKIKSGTIKPFFLTIMHQAPKVDVRLKLTAQNHFAKVGSR